MLSPAQELAATTPGHVVIAACPGSGKTTVLKFRAAHLLTSDPDSRLAAVTFTSDAAASLRERIIKQYPAAKSRMYAGTFHSLCKSQLQASGVKVVVLETGASARMIRNLIQNVPIPDPNLQFEDYVEAIDNWYREVDPVLPPKDSSPLAWVYLEFIKTKRNHGVIDFNDMLRDAVVGMRSGAIKPLSVRYMLVDEFQDTDAMQMLWVLEHIKAGVDVTIVGDDDQSIFGWRGGLGYEGMIKFKDMTGATLINLDRTYRCAREILQPAALLISHNFNRVPKQLVTASKDVGQVRVRTFEDRHAEAEAVIAAVLATDNPSEWGILARTNAQLELVESMIGNQFPFFRKGGKSFWELKAPSLLLGLAKDLSSGKMLGVSDVLTQAGAKTSVVDSLADQVNFKAPGALDRFCKARISPGGGRDLARHLQGQLASWRDMVRSERQSDIKLALNGMAVCILKYGRWAQRDIDETTKRLNMATMSIASMRGRMDQRLMALTRTKSEDKEKLEGASLMTLHASKGLEFDHVWMVGFENGTLPFASEDSKEDEERRLAYVGITRARIDLTMSYTLTSGPSKFLNECGLIGQRSLLNAQHELMQA